MNLRDIAKKVGGYISSKNQDDEGWIRQGKFTPSNFWDTGAGKGLVKAQETVQNPQLGQKAGDWFRNVGQTQAPAFKSKFAQDTVRGISNYAGNIVQPFLAGAQQAGLATSNLISTPNLDRNLPQKAQNVIKLAMGVGRATLPTNPLYAVTSAISSLPQMGQKDPIRRISAGITKGMSQQNVSTNVPEIKTKLGPIGEVDLVQGVGQLVGYAKQPLWDKLNPALSVINKGEILKNPLANYLMTRYAKGGIEGIIQGFADMPDNISDKEKAKFMLNNILVNATGEIVMDKTGDMVGKGFKRVFYGPEIEKLTPEVTGYLAKTYKQFRDASGKYAKRFGDYPGVTESEAQILKRIDNTRIGGLTKEDMDIAKQLGSKVDWDNRLQVGQGTRNVGNVERIVKSQGVIPEGRTTIRNGYKETLNPDGTTDYVPLTAKEKASLPKTDVPVKQSSPNQDGGVFEVYDGARGPQYSVKGSLSRAEVTSLKNGDNFSADVSTGPTQGRHEGTITKIEVIKNMEGNSSAKIDYTDPFGNAKFANIPLEGAEVVKPDIFKIDTYSKPPSPSIPSVKTGEIKQPTIKIKPSEKIKIKAGNDQNLLNNQQNPLGTGKPSVFSSQGNGQAPLQPKSPTIKIKVGQPNQISSGKPPSEPIIPQIKLSDIEKKIYGSETKLGNTGNKTSVGLLGNKIRIVEIKANEIIAKGLTAKNPVVRTAATLFQDLFGGAGKSPEQLSQKAQFRGGTDYATKIAGDTQDYVYKLLNNDTKSLERVHAVLDPEISKLKINESSLTASEKEALKLVREVSDYINDTNHSLGFISDELWQANRGGKYLARAYETFDYPPEVADFIKNKSLKFDINPFKKRTEMTDWKKENAITDPAYLIGKRLQQTLFNSEVKKYVDWATKNNLISDVQKPGYFQLSDSKAYGSAAGKWIRKDALEDIKGFFVTNDIGQKAYDILNWYDRNPIRRTQKMLKTVFNPAVRLGNKTGNYVFAWLNGINPVTFAKNRAWAKNALNTNDPIYRYAVQNGLTGSDITKADITRISAELKRGVTDPNTLQKINDWAKESYGRVDDVSKVAAFKSWLDRGVSPEEALNRTRRGFQDYNMVGMLYDLGAKIPILGNPFVRFASESVRIVKNAAVDHPFRLAATISAWVLFKNVMSRMTGETEEDKKTREGRVGASHLPFTNISTNVMTPYGEVNASRLLGFSTTFTPEDTGKLGSLGTDISKYSPFQNPLDARSYTNDPVIGPVISIATDKDFRGKSIADPKQNKYTGSLLTPSEQNMNKLSYGLRSYLPPSFTDLYNIGAATQGKENVYGQVKTPLQAILRTYPGVKVEQFGPEEAEATRKRNADYNAYELDYIQKQINAVKKQQAEGTITPQQAEKRIESLNKEKITSQSDRLRTFETSPEAPKDIMARISLATQATITNPANALKVVQAIFTEERMRKLSGDTLIFERETNLNKTKEKGDAVDHIIPLSLGGDNSDKNTRYISAEANQEKAKLETSLARKLASGEITGAEARKQVKNFINNNIDEFVPSSGSTETDSNTESTGESTGKIYKLTNEKTGKDTEIDMTFPVYPKLTGLTETDKELKADYYSALSKIKTNAGKLYDAGKITAQEYEDILVKIKGNKSKSGKGRKISIKASPKMKITKAKKIAMIKFKIPKAKPIKFKKLKTAKSKLAKITKIKIKKSVV